MRTITRYIYQQEDWPNFTWDQRRLTEPLATVSGHQGRLIGG